MHLTNAASDSKKKFIPQVFHPFIIFPLQSFLGIILLSILLALPTSLWVIYKNIEIANYSWENSPKINLFLKWGSTEEQAKNLLVQINKRSDVAKAVYISPLQGLKEFIQQTGLTKVFENLQFNPLPQAIVVLPTLSINSQQKLDDLVIELKKLPQVASVLFNGTALVKLFGYLNFWKKLVCGFTLFWILPCLLAGLFVFQSQNFINLDLDKSKKIGFLFYGILIGILSSLLAFLIVVFLKQILNYSMEYVVVLFYLILSGAILGLLGAGLSFLMRYSSKQSCLT